MLIIRSNLREYWFVVFRASVITVIVIIVAAHYLSVIKEKEFGWAYKVITKRSIRFEVKLVRNLRGRKKERKKDWTIRR